MTAGSLRPSPWRLVENEPPPAPELMASLRDGAEPPPPALLLIERREPLSPPCSERLAALLSSDERQRHDAYRLPDDRERFLLARAGLRRLLGHWLGLPPEAVPLTTEALGKPVCPGGPAFNVSHSGDLILLALHPLRPVGVDVERLRPGLDWAAIATRMLTPAERETIAGLPANQRPQAFLAAWCRLEARLKARGTGLAGLEQLRRETQVPSTADAPSAPAWPGRDPRDAAGPVPAFPQGCAEPTAAPIQPEVVWDVAVPDGYRAAAALARPAAEAQPAP